MFTSLTNQQQQKLMEERIRNGSLMRRVNYGSLIERLINKITAELGDYN